jgi:uncharacterized membrane protein YoaK (UPF0700 family)
VAVRVRDEHILLLTCAAGCLDVISYRGLGNVFTANMTGNTVLLGIALSQGDSQMLLLTSIALGGFCLGAFGGGLCMEWSRRRAIWTVHRVAVLVADTVLVVAFSTIWLALGSPLHPHPAWLLLLLATLAMGLQSILTLALVSFPGLSTTYFTGTLTHFMAGVAGLLHITVRPSADQGTGTELLQDEYNVARLAIMWLVFALAALVSSVLFTLMLPVAICSPLAANLLVVLDVLLHQWWQRRRG